MPVETWSADRYRQHHRLGEFAKTKVGAGVKRRLGALPPTLETRCAAPRKRNVKIVEVRTGEQVESVSVTITGWPPSVNQKGNGRWHHAKLIKEYKAHATPFWEAALADKAIVKVDCYRLDLVLYGDRRGDVSNRIKAAEDACADAVGENDCHFDKGSWNRIAAKERSHVVTLTAMREKV